MAPPEPDGLPPERLPRRLETVRFYVDEDLLPVGNAMMWTRTDVIVCGARPIADELPLGTPDLDWIPRVAAHDWIVVTGRTSMAWAGTMERLRIFTAGNSSSRMAR